MWTRSFALDRGSSYTQLAAAFVPLGAAFLVAGGWYPSMIVISLLPLVLFIKSSSNRLKGEFSGPRSPNAIEAQCSPGDFIPRSQKNNMSHGLCMIDRQGRLILANDSFILNFSIPPEAELAGAHARAVFRRLVRSRSIDEAGFVPRPYAVFGKTNESRISSCRSTFPTAGRSKSQFTRRNTMVRR